MIAPPPRLRAHRSQRRRFAHQHHAALAAPAAETQGRRHHFPALARVLPRAASPQRPLDQRFDFGRVPQFEETRQPALLRRAQQHLVAVAAIAPHHGRPMRARQRLQQRPEPRQRMPRRVLLAAEDLHPEAEPGVGHEIAVVGMARPARLVRVVPELGPLLPTVDRLDGHIDVQDPRLAQDRLHARPQLAPKPRQARGFLQPPPRSAHHILAHRAAHPEQRRIEPVAPHRVDVRIPPVPAQNRERRRAEHIDHLAPAIAAIGQRRISEELLPPPAHVQELREEDELPLAGHRRLVVKLRKIPPARRIDRPRKLLQSGLTQRVNGDGAFQGRHPSPQQLFAPMTRAFHSRF